MIRNPSTSKGNDQTSKDLNPVQDDEKRTHLKTACHSGPRTIGAGNDPESIQLKG